jgi:hypothetical protein
MIRVLVELVSCAHLALARSLPPLHSFASSFPPHLTHSLAFIHTTHSLARSINGLAQSLILLIYLGRTTATSVTTRSLTHSITHSHSLISLTHSLHGLAHSSLVRSLISLSRAQGVDAMARDEMLRLWGELQAAPSTSSGGVLRAECHKPAVYDMIYGQNMVDLATGVLGSDTFKLYPGCVAPPPFAKKRPCSIVLHNVPLCYARVSGRASSSSTICVNSDD